MLSKYPSIFRTNRLNMPDTKNKNPDNQKIIRILSTQSRDRTGMEVNPLVFETSASTNSAIWAIALQK